MAGELHWVLRMAGTLLLVPLWSVGAVALEISLSETTAPPGGIAALRLDIQESGGSPTALFVSFTFDTTVLSACAVKTGAAALESTVDFATTDSGMGLVVFGATTALGVGTIATIYLEVNPDAPPDTLLSIDNDGASAANASAEGVAVTVMNSSVRVLPLLAPHTADTNRNGRMELGEILRVVQLFSGGAIYCDSGSEDGYSTTPSPRDCVSHALDYGPQDWRIDLSELLRCIQFYNAIKGTYHQDGDGEDGFAPNPPGADPVD